MHLFGFAVSVSISALNYFTYYLILTYCYTVYVLLGNNFTCAIQ